MRGVEEWKALLRAELKKALSARQKSTLAAIRETIAAIENAEAPPMSAAPETSDDAVVAKSVRGVGAGDAERLELSPSAVASIVEREIQDRRSAASEYTSLDQHEEADVLRQQADFLESLARVDAG